MADCPIHCSFNRCISVHLTFNSTVSEKFVYDVIGHCYYLEQGAEENNVFSYNLGAHIHYLGTAHITSSALFGTFTGQTMNSIYKVRISLYQQIFLRLPSTLQMPTTYILAMLLQVDGQVTPFQI